MKEDQLLNCHCDPAKKFLRSFMHQILESENDCLEIALELSQEDRRKLVSGIVESCVDLIDIGKMIEISLCDIKLNLSTKFPVLKISSQDLEKATKKLRKSNLFQPCNQKKNLDLKAFDKELADSGLACIKIDRAGEYDDSVCVWLSPKEVIEKSINWAIKYVPRDRDRKIEKLCHSKESRMAKVVLHKSLDAQSIFTALMISRLLNFVGYKTCTESFQVADCRLDDSKLLVMFGETDVNQPKLRYAEWDFNVNWNQGVDAKIIPYTMDRINSILTTYKSLVASGEYPSLIPIDLVDFSVLTDEKEEVPLVTMLFYWPLMYEYVINWKSKNQKRIDLLLLFQFMKKFGTFFETFYSRVKVIVPKGAGHSFNKMMARLYLLNAIRNVFEEFSYIYKSIK